MDVVTADVDTSCLIQVLTYRLPDGDGFCFKISKGCAGFYMKRTDVESQANVEVKENPTV